MDTVQVEYVGLKARQPDTVAGTKLVWEGAGAVHAVPVAAWPRMARHPDVWRLVEGKKPAANARMTLGDIEVALNKDGTSEVIEPPAAEPVAGDALDALDGPALHALAKERGLKIHHKAGADKVRAALRAV